MSDLALRQTATARRWENRPNGPIEYINGFRLHPEIPNSGVGGAELTKSLGVIILKPWWVMTAAYSSVQSS